MSQTKYKLPDDLKIQCISLVRGYTRRVELYHRRRNDVLHPPVVPASDMPRGKKIPDTTYRNVLTLDTIDELPDTKAMRAVEDAKLLIGLDCDDKQRLRLRDAIWDSCIEGRNFKFDYYDLPIGRDNFYERRRRFLWSIAQNMGFL